MVRRSRCSSLNGRADDPPHRDRPPGAPNEAPLRFFPVIDKPLIGTINHIAATGGWSMPGAEMTPLLAQVVGLCTRSGLAAEILPLGGMSSSPTAAPKPRRKWR